MIKKAFIIAAASVFCSRHCFAQSGSNQLAGGVNVSFLTSDGYSGHYQPGFGFGAKVLLGIGRSGQLSFTADYDQFAGARADSNRRVYLLPVMAGYRYYFTKNFYLGSQAGVSFMTVTGLKDPFSQTMFAGALNAGVANSIGEVGARYYIQANGVSFIGFSLLWYWPTESPRD